MYGLNALLLSVFVSSYFYLDRLSNPVLFILYINPFELFFSKSFETRMGVKVTPCISWARFSSLIFSMLRDFLISIYIPL